MDSTISRNYGTVLATRIVRGGHNTSINVAHEAGRARTSPPCRLDSVAQSGAFLHDRGSLRRSMIVILIVAVRGENRLVVID
jgi:hypothetical protein